MFSLFYYNYLFNTLNGDTFLLCYNLCKDFKRDLDGEFLGVTCLSVFY